MAEVLGRGWQLVPVVQVKLPTDVVQGQALFRVVVLEAQGIRVLQNFVMAGMKSQNQML